MMVRAAEASVDTVIQQEGLRVRLEVINESDINDCYLLLIFRRARCRVL